jgi:hypothetical protein
MTAEQVLRLHTEGFNRALKQQDYRCTGDDLDYDDDSL